MRWQIVAILIVFPLMGLLSGCSLKSGEPQGFEVRLAHEANAITSSLLNYDILANGATIPLKTQGDLTCFGVNVRGGGIADFGRCKDVKAGITSGMLPGIGSTFQVTAPISEGTIFEAYGALTAGGCPDLFSSPDVVGLARSSLFRLGTITIPDKIPNPVVIPVSFDTTQNFNCTPGNAAAVFIEDFSYVSGSPLTTVASNVWELPSGVTGPSAASGALGTAPSNNVGAIWTRAVDPKKTFTRISLSANTSTVVSIPKIRIGLIDQAASSGSGNVFVCTADFSAPTSIKLGAGTGTAGFAPSGGVFSQQASAVTVASEIRMICEITTSSANGDATIVSTALDANGTVLTSFSQVAPNICPGCNRVFFNLDTGSATLTTVIDDFMVEQ